MTEDDLRDLDACGTADAIAAGEITAREAVEAAERRLAEWNPHINAVIHRSRDIDQRLDGVGEGRFAGVPFLLKDIGAPEAGEPYHLGSRVLREAAYVAPTDSFLARRFCDAGLVTLGRTNTPEFGLIATTEPVATGVSRNPWDLSRSTGGSSGGSSAAVAARIVPAAHANDGGGSTRIPAAVNGLVGLKSTRGRVSNGPGLGEAWAGLSHEGFVTRSVRDAAALLDVVSGYEVGDPYTAPVPARPFAEAATAPPPKLRIALMPTIAGVACDAEISGACVAAGKLLEDLGHSVSLVTPPTMKRLDDVVAHVYAVFAACAAYDVDVVERMLGRPVSLDHLEPLTAYHAERGRQMTSVDYLSTCEWLSVYARELCAEWDAFDILLCPTVAELAPSLGDLPFDAANPERSLARMFEFIPFTAQFNITGQPAISLPLARSLSGLPIGVQFVGPWGRDDLLLQLAAQVEQASPWTGPGPTLPA